MADDPSPLARTTSSSAAFPSSPSAVSQSLSSILNNPHAPRSDASWYLWWPSAPTAAPDFAPIPPSPFPPITRSDFLPYITYITAPHSRFEDIRIHNSLTPSPSATPGNALIACLREVPSLFFNENFALEDGGTFQSACPFSASEDANLALQERLTQYLDVVEMHLVREIALRSDSFFEAQGQLQGLNGEIVEACGRIRGLKETIRILTGNLVGSARSVKELNATRGNLVVLQEKLTVIMYVSQAMAALKLLVAAGDCAGALDVTDDLQHLLHQQSGVAEGVLRKGY